MKTLLSACLVLIGVTALWAQPEPSAPPVVVPKTSLTGDHKIEVGIYLTSLYDLDSVTSSFTANFYVWTNQRAATFDPLESIVFPRTRRHEVIFQSLRDVNGTQWSLRRYRATFYHDWDLHNFPFDKHRIFIQVRDSAHRADEVRYTVDAEASGAAAKVDLPGWNVSDFRISVEDVTYDTDFGNPAADSPPPVFSWVTATVLMKRDAFWLFTKLLAGAYITVVASLFACMMKTTQPPVFAGRMGLQISCLFAAILNSRATDSILGRHDEITLPDILHVLSYFMIFLSMVITLRSRVLCERSEEERAKTMERRATLAVGIIFLIANIVLITRAALSPVQGAL